MVDRVLRSHVMTTPNRPSNGRAPNPTYDPRRTVAATALLAALVVGPILAVSYPVATGLFVAAAVATLAVAAVVRRRSAGTGNRELCVPDTAVRVDQ